jgi:gamma-glutamyl:cysteine ligase YbdK (ATP-grasp superfamily)
MSCTANCAGAGPRPPQRPAGPGPRWLSGNSPFWQGQDSEYASFRYQVWGRWPSSGPAGPFGTSRAYRETIEQMVASDTLIDAGMVYFDARLSERYPTLERLTAGPAA